LSFKAGDLLRIHDKNGEWWSGESCDGTKGIFPQSYMEENPLSDIAPDIPIDNEKLEN